MTRQGRWPRLDVRAVPFDGEPPRVSAGVVRCRTASSELVVKVALAPPRYDHANGLGKRTHLTVPVAEVEEYERHAADAPWVNWPAEDVIL